jgi:phosphoglycolate phosphatase-like HAD superfamily hydrolase
MDIKPEDAIYIGDEIRDIKAISHKDLRLKFIGAGWKGAYNTKESLNEAAKRYGYLKYDHYFIADSPGHITQVLLSTY